MLCQPVDVDDGASTNRQECQQLLLARAADVDRLASSINPIPPNTRIVRFAMPSTGSSVAIMPPWSKADLTRTYQREQAAEHHNMRQQIQQLVISRAISGLRIDSHCVGQSAQLIVADAAFLPDCGARTTWFRPKFFARKSAASLPPTWRRRRVAARLRYRPRPSAGPRLFRAASERVGVDRSPDPFAYIARCTEICPWKQDRELLTAVALHGVLGPQILRDLTGS